MNQNNSKKGEKIIILFAGILLVQFFTIFQLNVALLINNDLTMFLKLYLICIIGTKNWRKNVTLY